MPGVESAQRGAKSGAGAREPVVDMVVRKRTAVAEGVVHLTLEEPTGATLPAWEPGAHVDLLLDTDLVRQYSLCGDPADRSRFEMAVLREPNGRGGSVYVHTKFDVGARVEVRGPRNHFRLVDSGDYLFIGGGIGITPLLPMIEAVARAGVPWRLVYGGRSRGSMAFAQDLVARHGERVTVWPQDEAGLLPLDDLLSSPAAGTSVYCCGPEPLLAAVEDQCRRWPAGALHVERFTPRPIELTGPERAFTVELARTGRTLAISAEANLLDVIAAEGIEIVSSCKEGTCGTCETVVLAGIPDHRDSVLTEQERADCNVMLPCVSRCKSDVLVLDL